MDAAQLFQLFEENRNEERARQMSAYMRNLFPFLGIQTPKRRELSREFLKEARKKQAVDWEFVKRCWAKEEREYQYLALDYLKRMEKWLTARDTVKLKELALDKSWWDTVDVIDKLIGNIALNHPKINEKLLEWSVADNIWLRRIAINHQRGRKEKTDTQLLE